MIPAQPGWHTDRARDISRHSRGGSPMLDPIHLTRTTACCLVLLLAGSLPAQETVFLRGHEVTRNHVVYGSIDMLHGSSAVLNLGYAHGLKAGSPLVVLRQVKEQLIPIGGLTVLQTEADHSKAQVEGPFRVQVGDLVLIHASRLNLWGGTTRLDRLAQVRISRRLAEGGYNTFDADPELIDEVARDDEFQQRQHDKNQRPKFIGEAAARTSSNKGLMGAVVPLPAVDPEHPDLRDEEIAQLDATTLALRQFLDAARQRDTLIARLSTERLQTLPLLAGGGQVEEAHAPLLREALLSWTRKAVMPR